MDLRSLSIKYNYTSYIDDTLDSFFIPVLSNSCRYDRISGFFTSKLYPLVFCGLKEFIKNGGKIRLISGYIPSEDMELIGLDFNEIKELYLSKLNTDILNLIKIPNNYHLHLLGYMLVNNIINIKLALILNKKGKLASRDEIQELNNGMLHEKIGIFKDSNGNSISFSGSNNETVHGWYINREEFKVYNNWDESINYWKSDIEKFEKYWKDEEQFLKVIPLPNESIEILEKSAPKNLKLIGIDKIDNFYRKLEKLNPVYLKNEEIPSITKSENEIMVKSSKEVINDWIVDENNETPKILLLDFRKCQFEAIENWKKHNFNGIFQMATGSGKTLAAIRGAYELLNINKKLLILVIIPDKFLVQQWKENLRLYIRRVYPVSSSEKDPFKKISNFLKGFKANIFSCGFIVSTINSFEKVLEKISDINMDDILLIADEVHSVGAKYAKSILEKINPKFRLGLSATPDRQFDDEGTEFLIDYFKEIIYEYSIKDGQNEGFLCKYEYIPVICELNFNEIEKYTDITNKMRRCDPEEDKELFERLAMKRAEILKKAESKIPSLDSLIKNIHINREIRNAVIFCDDYSQIKPIEIVLEKNNINYAPFDSNTDLEMRIKLREQIISNSIDALLAKKCLDQGVDIPSLEMGFFLSSTGNPRQFIQRAGRLIRKVSYKEKNVKIFDFIVIPTILNPGEEIFDSIMQHEYKRIEYFLRGTDELNIAKVINEIFKRNKDPNVVKIFRNFREG